MAKRAAVILLIDDDPSLGEALVDLLAAHGHLPKLALSAEEAFQLLTAPHRIEVVILDLQLGVERGDWLVEKLRENGTKIPSIVVHSAQSLPELMRASKVVGAEAVLQKPCSPERLLEAIGLAMKD